MIKCKHCGEIIAQGQTHHCQETGESYSPDLLSTIVAEIISDAPSIPMDFSSDSNTSIDTPSSSIEFGGGDFGGGGAGSDF